MTSWCSLIDHVRRLPYGRNANRFDFGLVLTEHKGTCSTKHALRKTIAISNGIPKVDLVLCMYRMSQSNTPGIGSVLSENGLSYIPEAHCYLIIDGQRVDCTSINADIQRIQDDLLIEQLIVPDQVVDYKVEYHRTYISRWLEDMNSDKELEEVWAIRERCISSLGRPPRPKS